MIRLNWFVEVVKSDNYYIVANHLISQYIKIKYNPYLEYIFNHTVTAVDYYQICYNGCANGLDLEQLEKTITKLLELQILENIPIPDTLNKEQLLKKVPEIEYSKRFGLQIGWLSQFENNEYNRFQLFENIKNSSITIVGAGGVGCHIAILAASIGISKITIIDDDIIEESNLVRQIFYRQADINTKKVNSLKRFIYNFSSYTEVIAIEDYISDYNKASLYLDNTSIVVQTADAPRGKINQIVNQVCVQKKIPAIYIHNGTIGPFYIPGLSNCYSCFEKYAMTESGGMYSELINCIPEFQRRVSPSCVLGPWIQAYFAFEEIFSFLSKAKPPTLVNKILKINNYGRNTLLVDIPIYDNTCECNK